MRFGQDNSDSLTIGFWEDSSRKISGRKNITAPWSPKPNIGRSVSCFFLWYSMNMTEADKKRITDIAKKYELSLAVLFGSMATGHTHEKSDVDVGFLAEKEIDSREYERVTTELAAVFKNPDIQLTNLRNVSPVLKKKVADEGVVLYARNNHLFDIFQIHANKLYMETKPLRVYRDQQLKEFLEQHA